MVRGYFPTEAAIREILLSLRGRPGRLQEIAEAFFEAREGLKFRPIGRNNDGFATKGYPDAYAIRPDGRMIVAETTAGDWRAHVRDQDLPRLKALGSGAVGCYRLLVFRDEEAPIRQKNATTSAERPSEDALRREIAATCGIDPFDVEFVFLKQLARELRQPIHIPLLLELGLSVSPAPFQLASDVLPSGIREITPNREEFDQGLVVPGKALDDLLRALRTSDHVVLAGDGASGKTSLALSAGRRWLKDGCTALYLDLGSYDLNAPRAEGELIDVGARFATQDTLFILDNVHAAPDGSLASVLNAWRGLPERPKLLSTGRGKLTAAAGAYGPRTLRLQRCVSEEDLLAAYRRLARRFWQTDEPPVPPMKIVREWRAFSGDLVAFCLAVVPALPSHGRGSDWRLLRQRAVEYVRDTYLDVLPETQRDLVIKVAALARLEMPASLKSLGGRKPVEALEARLLMLTRHGAEGTRARLRLAHHNLGALILEAESGVEEHSYLAVFARADPFQGCYIARKLFEQGRTDAARALLRAVQSEALRFSPDFAPAYLATITQLYVDLNVSTEPEIERALIASLHSFLPKDSQSSPLMGLGGFLNFAHARMPRLYALAVERLAEPSIEGRLLADCRGALPSAIVSLFLHAEQHGLRIAVPLRRRLREATVLEAAAGRLAAQTPRDIEQFLRFFAAHEPTELTRFEAALTRGDRLGAIREVLLEGPFVEALRVLRTAPQTSRLVFTDIDGNAWRSRPWARERGLALLVGPAARILKAVGRPDLLGEVARQAVLQQNASDWRPARKGAKRLLAVLRAFPVDALDTLETFALELARSGDLDRIYNNTDIETSLELVHQLWMRLGDRAAVLVTSTFQRSLVGCFSPKAIEHPGGLRTMIRAAGLCNIVGVTRPETAWTGSLDRVPLKDDADALFAAGLAALVNV